MNKLVWVGEIIGKYSTPAKGDEKQAFTRLTLSRSQFVGGEKKYQTEICSALAWGRTAEQLDALEEGTTIWVEGPAQVGRPYELKSGNRAGEMAASLECRIRDWGYALSKRRQEAAADGDEAPARRAPAPPPVSGGDDELF